MGWNERCLLDTVFPGKIEGTSITHFFKSKLNAPDEIVTEIGRVFENAELKIETKGKKLVSFKVVDTLNQRVVFTGLFI